jgi:hypothetical protein
VRRIHHLLHLSEFLAALHHCSMCVPGKNYESRSLSDVFRERFVDRSALECSSRERKYGATHAMRPRSDAFNPRRNSTWFRFKLSFPQLDPCQPFLTVTLPRVIVTIQACAAPRHTASIMARTVTLRLVQLESADLVDAGFCDLKNLKLNSSVVSTNSLTPDAVSPRACVE